MNCSPFFVVLAGRKCERPGGPDHINNQPRGERRRGVTFRACVVSQRAEVALVRVSQ